MVENAVILAGGAGKRLWPASKGSRPKPFMRVDGEQTLLRRALERAFGLGIAGSVSIVTHEQYIEAVVGECLHLDSRLRSRIVVLGEPDARNTGPALALAAADISLDGKADERVMVMTADHLISPPEEFRQSVEQAASAAEEGFLVLFGIVPHSPATGYGYIEAPHGAGSTRDVLSFREKPDAVTAQGYLDSDRYFWNAGMFAYKTSVFASELKLCAPDLAAAFRNPEAGWFRRRTDSGVAVHEPTEALRSRYRDCPAMPVDRAVMERSKKIRMVEADFEWSDVGTWDVLAGMGSAASPKVFETDSARNYVYSDRPVALCGVEDLIVVVANNRVMVCKKGKSDLVGGFADQDTGP